MLTFSRWSSNAFMTRHDSVFGRVGPGPAGDGVSLRGLVRQGAWRRLRWPGRPRIRYVLYLYIAVTYCTLHAAQFCGAYVHVFLVGWTWWMFKRVIPLCGAHNDWYHIHLNMWLHCTVLTVNGVTFISCSTFTANHFVAYMFSSNKYNNQWVRDFNSWFWMSMTCAPLVSPRIDCFWTTNGKWLLAHLDEVHYIILRTWANPHLHVLTWSCMYYFPWTTGTAVTKFSHGTLHWLFLHYSHSDVELTLLLNWLS